MKKFILSIIILVIVVSVAGCNPFSPYNSIRTRMPAQVELCKEVIDWSNGKRFFEIVSEYGMPTDMKIVTERNNYGTGLQGMGAPGIENYHVHYEMTFVIPGHGQIVEIKMHFPTVLRVDQYDTMERFGGAKIPLNWTPDMKKISTSQLNYIISCGSFLLSANPQRRKDELERLGLTE